MRTTLLFLFCCFFLTVENTFGQGKSENYRMDDLEVTLPEGYKGHSRIMEGILNTSIRKEGSSPASQLIVTMIDMNAGELGRPLLDEELLAVKDIFFEQNEMPGFKYGTVSDYTFKNHRGFQAKGTGEVNGTKFNIVFKCVIFSHYMVQFQEWYGEDYSSDYEAIENSLRTCTKKNLSGMQVISKGGYSFTYNADKLYASVDERKNWLSFYFSFKEASYGDTFLQIDFTLNKETSVLGTIYLRHRIVPQYI